MSLFNKPILAIIKCAVAELYSHSKMEILFETHGFVKKANIVITNKISKASAYLDFQDWGDTENNARLLNLLSEVYITHKHLLEYKAEDNFGIIFEFKRLVSALSDMGIKWDGKRLSAFGSTSFLEIREIREIKDLNIENIQIEVSRAKENVEKDPDDAITAAEGIVVATCKKILSDLNIEYGKTDSPQKMLSSVMAAIELLPDNISEKTRGAEAIKKMLRSMITTVQSMAELRNLYGDSHGKSPGFKGLHPRHARLMLSASESISVFLIETAIHRGKTLK